MDEGDLGGIAGAVEHALAEKSASEADAVEAADQLAAFVNLNRMAISALVEPAVEVYEGGALVGGLYGVSLGRAFFGESMFHRARAASKVALVHLVARLKAGRYRLLDTQFVTEHLRSFGAVEVSRPAYHKLLDAALMGEGDFAALALDRPVSGSVVLARLAAA